ncbi:neuronal acetylcholine receptor subunit beta-3-like isoform X1 [Mytilus edulis]|uniref:Uncharacterized protein n=2 Tax=Mytilus edulis TaxID=6550 RepID=A0A8S3RME8_MYTED|nr:unnamed protein product [Mytilus edulis]
MLDFVMVYLLVSASHAAYQGLPNTSIVNDEERLIKTLMNGYDPRIRPVNASRSATIVALGLSITEIVELHEKGEILETTAYVRQMWEDSRLKWDPNQYSGTMAVHLPASSVWKPDVVLLNNVDTEISMKEPLIILLAHGAVFYSPQHRLRSRCELDLSRFPFDSQTCMIRFGSWTYDTTRVNFTHLGSKDNNIEYRDFRKNKEWSILESYVTKLEKQYDGGGEDKYSIMEYKFHLQRNPVYYTHMFIMPAVLVAALVPFQFMLPPESKERITLGSILMLGLLLLLTMLQDMLPETHSTVPTLASYYTITAVWIALSILTSIWTINIQSRGPRRQKVPVFIRHFFLRGLKRLVCLGDDTYYPLDESETVSMRGLDRPLDSMTKPDTTTTQSKMEKDIEEILRHVHTMAFRATVLEARQDVRNEWHQVALVIDRLLCFLFFITFLLYTFVLLG